MKKFMKKYGFITLMLLGIVAGCIVGAAWPGATALEPFGTLFINMMFCVVVPMVFCSIASAIANMSSAKRAGRIMGITVGTFLSTAAIAAILMYIIVHFIPVFTAAPSYEESGVGTVDIGTLIVNFFTKPDFTELWSRRAILPLIVAAIIFGFGIQMCGGRESRVALLLNDLTDILLKVIKLISYYAPVGFFGFFASLVATHGSDFVSNYARAIGIYYVVSVIYLLISSPLYARFGGGKGAAKVMFRHLFRPAATAFGTCSSVATIPVNMEVSEDTGISKEVSDIVMPLGARCTWTARPWAPSSRSRSSSACSARTSVRVRRSWRSLWRCSRRLPCPVFPAAAARASWCSARCSSRITLTWRSRSLLPSAS